MQTFLTLMHLCGSPMKLEFEKSTRTQGEGRLQISCCRVNFCCLYLNLIGIRLSSAATSSFPLCSFNTSSHPTSLSLAFSRAHSPDSSAVYSLQFLTSFVTFGMSPHGTLGVILLGWPPMRRFIIGPFMAPDSDWTFFPPLILFSKLFLLFSVYFG